MFISLDWACHTDMLCYFDFYSNGLVYFDIRTSIDNKIYKYNSLILFDYDIFIYQKFCLFLYSSFFSLCFALQCRLIVAQMSSTRCEGFHWMTPIYVATVIISLYVPFLERPLLYLLLIATTLCHWHYGTRVVSVSNEIIYTVHIENIS